MIQGHAYHGWASPAAKETAAYAVTRFFGALPLPAFLILAGAAVAFRVSAAVARGEDAGALRRRVMWRGATVVAWGYVANALYAWMDGYLSVAAVLRVDVLHCIGLSIATMAFLGIRASAPSRAPDPRRLSFAAGIVGVLVTVSCPWLTRASLDVGVPLGFVVGLFADVEGVTSMPVVPLIAWFCVGVGVAHAMIATNARARLRGEESSARGAPRRTLVWMGGGAALCAAAAFFAMNAVLDALGGELSRTHPAVLLNVVELAGRGVVLVALGVLLTDHLRGFARTAFLRLGRGSLLAYVFHIPFCYGKIGGAFADRLSMWEATIAVVALIALSYAVVHARDGLRQRVREARRAGMTA
jgi:hypothetical protein